MESNLDMELLINLVRGYTYLYDKRDKRYKDLVVKENCWRLISETLVSTPDVCQKTWTSLRDKYTRERKKVKTLPSGSSSEVIDSQWVWYKDMTFLDKFVQERRRTTSNLQNGSDHSSGRILNEEQSQVRFTQHFVDKESYPEFSEEALPKNSNPSPELALEEDQLTNTTTSSVASTSSAIQTTSAIKKRKYDKHQDQPADVDGKILETLAAINNKKKPVEEAAFGELVATELGKIADLRKRRAFKRAILDIIYSDD